MSALTLDISASSPGIIAIEATHWAGARELGPHFELYPHGQPEVIPSIDQGDLHVTLSSGD
ncbi:hypothetical protein, partial [Oceanobacillus saliphilus]|uniref:hypothetical protein n=1 Tax=Oceanobacillus saliphilus TaxID=2925834 RepID=UPI00201DBF5B